MLDEGRREHDPRGSLRNERQRVRSAKHSEFSRVFISPEQGAGDGKRASAGPEPVGGFRAAENLRRLRPRHAGPEPSAPCPLLRAPCLIQRTLLTWGSMTIPCYEYDVVVVGAGHAGTEAALAAARMGARVALLTTNCDTVGQMSCNPAIGGVAKGQIVREIDALGGVMGRAIDATGIQFRMLNLRKGPAMHSPRAQADKKAYQFEVKRIVEEQAGLDLRQESVEDLSTEETLDGPRVRGSACAWRRRLSRARGGAHHRNVSPGAHAHRGNQDAGRTGGRGDDGGTLRGAAPTRFHRASLQDRNAPAAQWSHDRFFPHGAPAWGRRTAAVLVPPRSHRTTSTAVLDHVYQRRRP